MWTNLAHIDLAPGVLDLFMRTSNIRKRQDMSG